MQGNSFTFIYVALAGHVKHNINRPNYGWQVHVLISSFNGGIEHLKKLETCPKNVAHYLLHNVGDKTFISYNCRTKIRIKQNCLSFNLEYNL